MIDRTSPLKLNPYTFLGIANPLSPWFSIYKPKLASYIPISGLALKRFPPAIISWSPSLSKSSTNIEYIGENWALWGSLYNSKFPSPWFIKIELERIFTSSFKLSLSCS